MTLTKEKTYVKTKYQKTIKPKDDSINLYTESYEALKFITRIYLLTEVYLSISFTNPYRHMIREISHK